MQALAGAGAGVLSGAFANDQNRGKMSTAGNAYNMSQQEIDRQKNIQKDIQDRIGSYGGDPTKELQNNEVLGGMFGKGGTLDRTTEEEKNLASQGFELTPEDRTAYGQASGDIARQFGESDQSLAQSLADRGLSNSGVAGAAFTGSQGNKMEQLAKVQQSIAKQRMETNMQRLGQTRQFLSQLGSQGANDINEMQQLGRQKSEDYNAANQQRFNMAENMLGNYQGQMNNQLNQEQTTKHGSDIGNMVNGGLGGAMMGAKMGAMSSGPKKPTNSMEGQEDF